MRLLVIGGSDAGIAAALRARELDPSVEVTVVVADAFPNFSICGLPFYLSGDVPDWRDLAHRTTSDLEQAGVRLLLEHIAQAVDPAAKQVTVTSQRDAERQLGYDRLVIGTGAVPVRPPIDGLDLPGVHVLHTMADTFALHQALTVGAHSAVIVGGGYIGLEMAEAFTARGLAVTVVEQAPAVMPTVDVELGRLLGEELGRHDVQVVNDVTFKAIHQEAGGLTVAGEPDFAVTADLVLVVVGLRPDTELAVAAGVQTGVRGGRPGRPAHADQPPRRPRGRGLRGDLASAAPGAHLPAAGHDRAQAGPGRRRDRRRQRPGVRRLARDPGGQGVRAGPGPHRPPRPRKPKRPGSSRSRLARPSSTTRLTTRAPTSSTSASPATRPAASCRAPSWVGDHRAEVAKRIGIPANALFRHMTVDGLSDLDLSYTPPFGSPWDAVQLAAQDSVRQTRIQPA